MYGVNNGAYPQSGYQVPQVGQQYTAGVQTYVPQTQGMQYIYAPQQQTQPVYQNLRSRPVANFEEVNAAMIDLDGSVFVFPCDAQRCIYTKQIGLDGNPIIRTYVLEEQRQEAIETKQEEKLYVLKSDYEKAIKRIETKVNKLLKGGVKNETSKYDDESHDEQIER